MSEGPVGEAGVVGSCSGAERGQLSSAAEVDLACVGQGSLITGGRKASSFWLSLKRNTLAHPSGQSKDEVSRGRRKKGCLQKGNILVKQKEGRGRWRRRRRRRERGGKGTDHRNRLRHEGFHAQGPSASILQAPTLLFSEQLHNIGIVITPIL